MLKKEQSVKKTFTLMLAGILLVALLAPVIQAETKVTIDGQVRVREMLDKTSFDTSAVFDHFVEMRSRVGVKAVVDDNATAYIQLQDSRVFGATNLQALNDTTNAAVKQSGGLSNSKNVDVHQAYISIKNLFGERFGAMIGRFEFNHGNQRVFGAVGWHNVSRSWDGGMYWYDHEKFKISAIWLKPLENRDTTYNRDFDVVGLAGVYKQLNLQWFAVWENDADTNGYAPDVQMLSRIDLGLYYQRKMEQADVEMNVVYQTGSKARGMLPDSNKYDIAAYLFTFEAGYSLEGEKNARVAVGVDFASGQDLADSNSTDWKAYDNMYYTGHKFRGYMDYFVPSGNAGLIDIMGRAKFDPIPGWTVKGDFHFFKSAQDYIVNIDGGADEVTSDVGSEIDISISTKQVSGLMLNCGLSFFLPSEAFAESTEKEAGIWAYSMATINF